MKGHFIFSCFQTSPNSQKINQVHTTNSKIPVTSRHPLDQCDSVREPAPVFVSHPGRKITLRRTWYHVWCPVPFQKKNSQQSFRRNWCLGGVSCFKGLGCLRWTGSMTMVTMRSFCWSKYIGWHKIIRKIHNLHSHCAVGFFPPKFIDTVIGLWIVHLDCAACEQIVPMTQILHTIYTMIFRAGKSLLS